MKVASKAFILLWFAVTSLALVALTLKPIGVANTLRSVVMPLVRGMSTERETVLCGFDAPRDFSSWHWQGIYMEPSQEHVVNGDHSAKVTYLGRHEVAGIASENEDTGPLGVRDWSAYGSLRANVYNPQPETLPLHLKIKDGAGREVDRIIELKTGWTGIAVDLDDLGHYLDLRDIVYVNFYMLGLEKDRVLYFDAIRLERSDPHGKRMRDGPVLTLASVSCPNGARRGEEMTFSISFVLEREIAHDYQVFIHVVKADEFQRKGKKTWHVNVDQEPWVPTSRWKARTPYEIGPLRIFIPKGYPAGAYVVQAGLFNPASRGEKSRLRAGAGMTDFSSGYPRLRYTDRRIKDFVVARFDVL